MSCLNTTKILFPSNNIDLEKWSVVACDQYTSEPEYWQEVFSNVCNDASTFHITLPEIYLEDDDVLEKTKVIHKTMDNYLEDGTLCELEEGLILVERYSGGKYARRGVVLAVDLEEYDFNQGSSSKIRPTEKTIVERIPPRLDIRKGGAIEIPHVMLIIDDPAKEIIEPLFEQQREPLYDVELMQKSGHIKGYFIKKGQETDKIISSLNTLFNEDTFAKKYNLEQAKYPVLPFAVGDGNHSLATAKSHWLEISKNLTDEQKKSHPARLCLVEIVNIHEKSLIIEPIHRVMFDVSPKKILEDAILFFKENGCVANISENLPKDLKNAHVFPFFTEEKNQFLIVENPSWAIGIATLQTFLDDFLNKNTKSKIDYIHGEDVVKKLSKNKETVGFILPDIEKADIFRGVILDGVLPRKTFSMGEAHEKRFYMESRKISI